MFVFIIIDVDSPGVIPDCVSVTVSPVDGATFPSHTLQGQTGGQETGGHRGNVRQRLQGT